MMIKILLTDNPTINKNTFYLADYPWYSTKEWANTIQNILRSKNIKTAPLWILRVVAFIGDLIKKMITYVKLILELTTKLHTNCSQFFQMNLPISVKN